MTILRTWRVGQHLLVSELDATTDIELCIDGAAVRISRQDFEDMASLVYELAPSNATLPLPLS